MCANFISRSQNYFIHISGQILNCLHCFKWSLFKKFVFLPFLYIVCFPFRKPSLFCDQWSNRNGITSGRLENRDIWFVCLFVLVYNILQRTHSFKKHTCLKIKKRTSWYAFLKNKTGWVLVLRCNVKNYHSLCFLSCDSA